MARGKELTVTFYIGDKQVPVGKLPDEYLDKMAERLGRTMSCYYTAHPDQWVRFCDEQDQKAAEGKRISV